MSKSIYNLTGSTGEKVANKINKSLEFVGLGAKNIGETIVIKKLQEFE